MTRYYFHLYDDIVARDDCGMELPDVMAAHREALRSARALGSEQIQQHSRLDLSHRVEVEDEHGEMVLVVPFRSAFMIEE